jgi:hypothetical protein
MNIYVCWFPYIEGVNAFLSRFFFFNKISASIIFYCNKFLNFIKKNKEPSIVQNKL